MVKKILFAALVLFGLGFAGMTGDCFADTAELYAAAKKYEKSMQYEQARNLYQKVIADEPNSERALKAQKHLAYILIEQDAEAQPEIDKLIENFAGHPGLPKALWNIAQRYEYSRRYYQQARDVYNLVIEIAPDSSYTDKAKLDVAKVDILALIDTDREAEAEAAIEKLTADFSGHSYLPAALHGIARRYEELSRYEKARSIYQQIIQGYPDSSYASKAQMDVPKVNVLLFVESGQTEAVWTALDGLLADFTDHPDLPEAVFRIGKKYYKGAFRYENEGRDEQARDYFTKAIGVWQKGIQGFAPSAVYTPLAYFCSAACYADLADYEKAIEYYERLLANWPDFDDVRVPLAYFELARCYEKLEKAGQIPTAEAAVAICQACEKILADYPDTNPAIIQTARKLLQRYEAGK